MYRKIICLDCGFIFYITEDDLIKYDDKFYVKCRLCDNKQEYKKRCKK